MKNSRKRIKFKNGCGLLIVVLFAGSVAISVPRAEPKDGKDNASDGLAAVKRDPFWPVGYLPEQMQDASQGEVPKITGGIDWDKARGKIVINGVSSRADNEYFAMINNEVKRVGESVSILYGSLRYTWTVERITSSGSVKLRQHAVEKERKVIK